jgi:EAL domain-containing protein (putative c-di-GMP-specific phosphodiesterase class I)
MAKKIDPNSLYNSAPFKIVLIMISCFFLNYIAYFINGNSNPWQLLYLMPMLVTAFLFDTKGSVSVAILIILLNSPLLLLTRFKLSYQLSSYWILRSLIYLIIAIILGVLSKAIKKIHIRLIDDSLKSNFSGFYNTTKLVSDLEKLNKEKQVYDLVFIHIINIDELRKYLDSNVFSQLINKEFESLQKEFHKSEIYSYSSDQYILVIKDNTLDDRGIRNLVNHKIHQFVRSNSFDKYSVKFQIKCGIINSNVDNNPRRLIQKVRITSERGSLNETSIYIFDKAYYERRQLYYEVSLSLETAITNDELSIVYQPIIDVKSKSICSCEALLRWDRGNRKSVNPNIFITVAEQTGLIVDVTKWLIRNTIINQQNWKMKEKMITQSINVSAKELIDDAFQNWLNEILKKNEMGYDDFNIEITERVLSTNDKRLKESLVSLQQKGCTIEIDDFGTGYNSFKLISTLPINVVKLDKFFIDNLHETKTKILIEYLIGAIHQLGGVVIAEGVETKQQFDTLVQFGCDKIQGFYFSKPLESDKFCSFCNDFDYSKY